MNRMKRTLLTLPLLLAACTTPDKDFEDRSIRNMWVGDHMRNASMEQAVLTEKTLYAHHFDTDSAALSQLGRRDLGILSDHLAANSGRLVVKRGDASTELYAARIETVTNVLKAAGLAEDQIRVSDGSPGGDGISSDRLVEIFADVEVAQDGGSLMNMIGGN